jgi:hypothetical protein
MSTPSVQAKQATSEQERSRLVESINKNLDQWRRRIDELAVQADLAKLDVRDLARKQLDTAQNAYLAASFKLAEARKDAGVSIETLRTGLEQLLQDVKDAFEAAQAVIERG